MVFSQKLALALLAAATTTFYACKKNESDTQAPALTVNQLTPAVGSDTICGALATNVIHVDGGSNLSITFAATDNVELGQYKIDIHDDFDCHGHDGERSPSPTVWTMQDIVNLTGTQQTITRDIAVPSDIYAGNYHFQVSLIDKAGNELQTNHIYTLKIRNMNDTIAPTLTYAMPNSVNRGATLTVTGTASDNVALENGRVELVYHNQNEERVVAALYTFAAAAGTSTNFTLNYVVPTSLTTGTYEFEVLLYDAVGNLVDSDYSVAIQ